MFEAVLRMTGDLLAVKTALGVRRERSGGESPLHPASATLPTADGRFVAVSAPSWDAVGAALERLGRAGSGDPARARAELAAFAGERDAEKIAHELRAAGVPAQPVNSVIELLREPHLRERGALIRVVDPEHGEITVPGVVPSLSRTPGRVTGWPRRAGADNEAVLGGVLGYSSAEIASAIEGAGRGSRS